MRIALGSTAAALIALAALASLALIPRLVPARIELKGPAPDFVLPVIAGGDEGARLKLSDLRGKIVIVDFWATWCEPCAVQAPILDRIARRHPRDVVVLGINVADEPELARRYALAKRLSYPILLDQDGEVQEAYGAFTLPSLVIVDRQGQIHRAVTGLVRQSTIDKMIRQLEQPR